MSWRHIYRWDLDKTYLETDFESLRRLVLIAFEKPEEKTNVPGSASLLRELGRDHEDRDPSRVCIVSGSPRQMRRTLEKKLELDGVRWHEFHLKPQWENLRRGRFRAVREQVGYKLPLLLRSRLKTEDGGGVGETLFGDDAEVDAFIYSLYADVLAGRVTTDGLVRVLRAVGAYDDAVDKAAATAEKLDDDDCVERIFIMLDRRTPPGFFRPFGPRVVPIYNYFQAALVLFSGGHLTPEGVVSVTRSFLDAEGHSADDLANFFQDVVRRGHLPATAMQDLGLAVQELSGVPNEAEVIWKSVQKFSDLGASRRFLPPSPPPGGDYEALLAHLRSRHA
ncbi:MAG: hypothetical protein KDA24_19235 [Deltaproteobacteria bacterium]|nr:hypothetical protein [Deltaproteobacteria bacterium]